MSDLAKTTVTTDRDAAAILGFGDSLDGRQLVQQAQGDFLPYEDAYEITAELIEIKAEKNYDSRGVRVLLRVDESSKPDLVKVNRQYTLMLFDQHKTLPDFVLAEMVVSRIQFAAALVRYDGDPLEEGPDGTPKFKSAPVLLDFHREVEPLGLKMRFRNVYQRTTRNGKKLHKLQFELV